MVSRPPAVHCVTFERVFSSVVATVLQTVCVECSLPRRQLWPLTGSRLKLTARYCMMNSSHSEWVRQNFAPCWTQFDSICVFQNCYMTVYITLPLSCGVDNETSPLHQEESLHLVLVRFDLVQLASVVI